MVGVLALPVEYVVSESLVLVRFPWMDLSLEESLWVEVFL